MVRNEENGGWQYLAGEKIICIITWNNFKTRVIFVA